jgi:hypothetical protein
MIKGAGGFSFPGTFSLKAHLTSRHYCINLFDTHKKYLLIFFTNVIAFKAKAEPAVKHHFWVFFC